MVCQKDILVQKVSELYSKISTLESLSPCNAVDTLFTELVFTCLPENPIDVTKLCKRIQEMRSNLIRLCGQAEGLMEMHFSTILGSFDDNPLNHLSIFPYFDNYLKLSLLEFEILSQYGPKKAPAKVAFLGSGPLPLTSIVLATYHLTSAVFHNYDIDSRANAAAARLVSSDPDLSERMVFHTTDVMDVGGEFEEYEVVFLAALVGMDKAEKAAVIGHLEKNMAPGAILMLRSAHGARGFLYPIVDPCDLKGFEVLSVFHPTNEVVNSVVIARKLGADIVGKPAVNNSQCEMGHVKFLPCKCSDIQGFNHFGKMNMMEELAAEDHLV